MDQQLFESTLQIALEHHEHGVANSRKKEFVGAFESWSRAEGLFERIAKSDDIEFSQQASVEMARAMTSMARGVGERCRGDLATAKAAIDAANARLDLLQIAIISETGRDWQTTRLGLKWHAAKGRVLTSAGALEFEAGKPQRAMEMWLDAEEHLFRNYVLKLGRSSKPSNIERTIRIWRNIMRAAVAAGNGKKAAEMPSNAIRLYNYFCNDAGRPEGIRNAFLDFLLEIERLEPHERSFLESQLSPQVAEFVASLIGDHGE